MTAPKMQYVYLGSSGLKVSRVILGAMSFGSPQWQPWVLDSSTALPILKHAYDSGINTWDTADVYSHGESERIVRCALEEYAIPRERVVILSKCHFGVAEEDMGTPIGAVATNDGAMANRVGLSRKHVFDAVEASVGRLGTYIDVLQIHRLDHGCSAEEIMKALNDVVEKGWVRYIGASSMTTWQFMHLQHVAERNGWCRFVSMQNYHNLIYREEEREMIPYCKFSGVGLIPWSPLARGVLSRPWGERDTAREKSDKTLINVIRGKENEVDKLIVGRVEEVAKKHGVKMATIATAWSIKKGDIPIIGLSSKERVDEAVKSSNFELSDEDANYLEEPYLPKTVSGFDPHVTWRSVGRL
ncbi:NADP-dependent oxidoreductase domain-containing protein [Elsinoe ampelina]|uniref:NADP-dependent oxidoreductase domain-containing protein n=1 Tax=Elsinoe ampelina TaxID=302913 RepID=A0A6A6GHH0_9PEZI|nr:NADP-dependent oxidoreductase domain-containing protein [Elsinoe ampelina]